MNAALGGKNAPCLTTMFMQLQSHFTLAGPSKSTCSHLNLVYCDQVQVYARVDSGTRQPCVALMVGTTSRTKFADPQKASFKQVPVRMCVITNGVSLHVFVYTE